MDRGNRVEHVALEHVVGKFDVELAFEREHHVDAGVRSHAGLVEVGFGGERVYIAAQPAVLLEDRTDLVLVWGAHFFLSRIRRVLCVTPQGYSRRGSRPPRPDARYVTPEIQPES